MKEAKHYTHIVLVGISAEKMIASLRQFPVHKIVTVTHCGDENKTDIQNSIKKLTQTFESLEFEKHNIETENILTASMQLLDIIKQETRDDTVVKVNISCGLRNIGVSAYIAAFVSGISIYSDIPEHEDEDTYILKGILDLPPIPIKDLSREQMDILEKLEDGVDSMDILISRMKPNHVKNSNKLGRERSRLSHHIKNLKNDRLVETEKCNRCLVIRRSELGEIYFKGKKIKDMQSQKNKK
ncbi:DUF6293 family protein [Methanolobus sp. ZRKC2]|uniref:HFX_2341 family transcriptional regulator domain-containing protein n=1 Tax=Methanolobus sp. ZRKC2 TaxID=3125783 RepID=UPI0032504CEC